VVLAGIDDVSVAFVLHAPIIQGWSIESMIVSKNQQPGNALYPHA
jgi:hypothetical protein